MYYQNELFCQLLEVEVGQQSRFYQLGYKYSQQGEFIVTCSTQICRFWGSLRTNFVKGLLINPSKIIFSFQRSLEQMTL